MNSRRITLQGRNWTQPDTSTDWQRERARPDLLPMITNPRMRIERVWPGIAVGAIFWTAFFCWILG